MLEELHQDSRVTSRGTVPLEILRIPFAIIREIQTWYHPAMTDSFLNIFEVGFPFWMELAMAMTLYQVTHALSNRIATTALAIFTYASSEKNGGGPHVGRVTPAGLWLYWWNVKTLTLIPIFARAFEAAAGVTILLATALQDILRPFFARVSQFLSNSPDRSAKIASTLNGLNGSTQISS